MSEPKRGEVREAKSGRRFYINGLREPDLDPGPAGMIFSQTVPLVDMIEVEGKGRGSRFSLLLDDVTNWKVVSSPCQSDD